VFAKVFGQDPDFFSFYRSMQAYEHSLNEAGTTMVLSPDNAFFKFLNDPNGILEASKTGPVKRGARVDIEKLTSDGKSLSEALCPEIIADAAPLAE
jgi:membrane protease subunit HflC